MKIKILTLAYLFFSISTNALADHKSRHHKTGYFSVGVTSINVDAKDFGIEIDHNMIEAKLGFDINSNFAIEARAARAIDNDTFFGANLEVETYAGLYLMGQIPLGKSASLYGFVGATYVRGNIDFNTLSATDSDSDSSYGVGLTFKIANQSSIGIEYADLYRQDNLDISNVSLSYKLSF